MALGERIKSFMAKCSRVWQILRKPGMEEFKMVSKISAIGLGVIGALGFLITIIMQYIYPK